MLNKSPQSPSRTLALMNRKLLAGIYTRSAAAPAAENVQRGVNAAPVLLNARSADSEAVYRTFEALDANLTQIRAISNVLHKDARYQTFSLPDILPVALSGQYSAPADAGAEEGEKMDIFDINMPMRDKIRILRERPDMLHAFVLDAQRAQKQQRAQRQNELLEQRRKHRREMHCDEAELIEDFTKHNIQHLYMARDNNSAVALLNARIADAASRKRRAEALAEFRGQCALTGPRGGRILPQIFTSYKNRLGVYLYITSRIGALRRVSALYQARTASNMRLLAARRVILRHLRARSDFNRAQAELSAVGVIARALRRRRCARDKNQRVRALERVRAHLITVYQQQTSLAAAVQFCSAAAQLKAYMTALSAKNAARAAALRCIVQPLQKAAAHAAWRREKEQFITKYLKMLQDPKQARNLKAFLAKYPPGAELTPDDADAARIAKLELTEEQISTLCREIVLYTVYYHENILQQNFAANNQPGALFLNIFNPIPTRNILEQAIDVMRKGQDVREWLQENEIELEQPQEYRA